MIKPIEFLKEVETNFEVEKIKINALPVWQILRWHFATAYENKNTISSINNDDVSKKSRFEKYQKVALKVKNSLWNIKNYNKKYSYMLFTDRLEERNIKGKIADKIAHGLIETLGDNILVCLNPINERHRSIEEYSHKQYVSTNLFELKKLKEKVDFEIENEQILLNIQKYYDFKLDYRSIIKIFLQYVQVFNKRFKKSKPKVIFVNCYYNIMHQALIFSAHLNNIKVIEFQHGIINDNHYAYNIFKFIGRETFSDYIFVFGDYVKDLISSNFIDKKNIHSIGNYYIENVLKESLSDKELENYFSDLRKKYKKIAVATSQVPVEEELIAFLKSSAKMDKETLYIFIPRYFNKDFDKYNFPENMIIHKDIDFYHTAAYSDVHLTVYSTCAIEALFYGIPNILININGFSKDNFGTLLGDRDYTNYVETPEELVNSIDNLGKINKDFVMNAAQRFYNANNVDNIIKELEKLNFYR